MDAGPTTSRRQPGPPEAADGYSAGLNETEERPRSRWVP